MSSDKHDDMQDAYNRILREHMHMAITNPLQNAAQGSIFGGMGAAQGSVLGGMHTQAMDYGQTNQRRIESMFDHNRQVQMHIVNADNGFILTMRAAHPGARDRVLVANTIEELRDLFTSELVSRKMEK